MTRKIINLANERKRRSTDEDVEADADFIQRHVVLSQPATEEP